jgi:hypothetical protein
MVPTISTDSNCYPRARIVKLESTTDKPIHIFEVEVNSSGNNIAVGGVAIQSSTFKSFGASLAIDDDINTFSHTNDNSAWWQVDLGTEQEIDSVQILNRWCGDPSDPNGCLCRLSDAKLILLDSQGSTIVTQSVGNTCGKLSPVFSFSSSFACPSVRPQPKYFMFGCVRNCLLT